ELGLELGKSRVELVRGSALDLGQRLLLGDVPELRDRGAVAHHLSATLRAGKYALGVAAPAWLVGIGAALERCGLDMRRAHDFIVVAPKGKQEGEGGSGSHTRSSATSVRMAQPCAYAQPGFATGGA